MTPLDIERERQLVGVSLSVAPVDFLAPILQSLNEKLGPMLWPLAARAHSFKHALV